MIVIFIILGVILVCFGAVLLFGAPYLPTLRSQIDISFKLANLKPGETLIDLGCGDGRVLIAAARQGLNAVGYELNPLLVLVAWIRTRPYRDRVTVRWANFWRQTWPPADCLFVFLLSRFMPQLDQKVAAYPHKPVKLVSNAFRIKDKTPIKKSQGVYLYQYK